MAIDLVRDRVGQRKLQIGKIGFELEVYLCLLVSQSLCIYVSPSFCLSVSIVGHDPIHHFLAIKSPVRDKVHFGSEKEQR